MKNNPWKSKPDVSESVDKEIRMGARAMIEQGKTAYRFWRELHEQGIAEFSLCDTLQPFNVRAMMDMWLAYTLRGARILYTRNPTIK